MPDSAIDRLTALLARLSAARQQIPDAGPADILPPTIVFIAPPREVTTAGPLPLRLNVQDNRTIASVIIRQGSTVLATLTNGPYGATADLSRADNGPVTFTAEATDEAGNVATATLTVQVAIPDTTPPTVALEADQANVTAPGPLVLTAEATDDAGIREVAFYRGSTLLGTDTTAPYTQTDQLTAARNGTQSYTAVATDTGGNRVTSAAVSVVVTIPVPDTTPPTVSLASSANPVTSPGALTLTATVADDVAVAKVDLYRGSTLVRTLTAAPYTLTDTVDRSWNGTYTYRAVATDTSGNTGEATRTVTVNIPQSYPSGASARYDFKQGADAGLLYDVSGNGHDRALGSGAGTDARDPAWDAAGLHFDGVDDYVSLLPADLGADVVTVLVQVRPDSDLTGNRRVLGVGFADGSVWELYREDTQDILAVRIGKTGGFTYPNFKDAWPLGQARFIGVRVHRLTGQVLLSVQGGPWRAYDTLATPITAAVTTVCVGADATGGNSWKGTIAALSVHPRALSDLEVSDAYGQTPVMPSPIIIPPPSPQLYVEPAEPWDAYAWNDSVGRSSVDGATLSITDALLDQYGSLVTDPVDGIQKWLLDFRNLPANIRHPRNMVSGQRAIYIATQRWVLGMHGQAMGVGGGGTSMGILGNVRDARYTFRDFTFHGPHLHMATGQYNGGVRPEGFKHAELHQVNLRRTLGFQGQGARLGDTAQQGFVMRMVHGWNTNGQIRDTTTATGWKPGSVNNSGRKVSNLWQLASSAVRLYKVEYCISDQQPGEGHIEDTGNSYDVELVGATGFVRCIYRVEVRGAYPLNLGDDYSGGGIIYDGSKPKFISAEECFVFNSSNYAFAHAGGGYTRFLDCVAYSLGLVNGSPADSTPDTAHYDRDYYSTPDTSGRVTDGLEVGWAAPTASNPNRRLDGPGDGTSSRGTVFRRIQKYNGGVGAITQSVINDAMARIEAKRQAAGVIVGRRNPTG